MTQGRPKTVRDSYVRKLQKETHGLQNDRKRTLQLKSDDEFAHHFLLRFLSIGQPTTAASQVATHPATNSGSTYKERSGNGNLIIENAESLNPDEGISRVPRLHWRGMQNVGGIAVTILNAFFHSLVENMQHQTQPCDHDEHEDMLLRYV